MFTKKKKMMAEPVDTKASKIYGPSKDAAKKMLTKTPKKKQLFAKGM